MSSNKSVLVAIAVVTILALLGGCQESEKSTPADPVEQPKVVESPPIEKPQPEVQPEVQAVKTMPAIKIENPVHDFGEIRPKSVHKGVFKFKNIGDGILKISKVQSTCGCTVPKLKKKEYAPGESGEVKVTYTSPIKEGKISPKKLYILSNDPKNKKAPLTIKANVVLAVNFNPKKLTLKLKSEDQSVKPIIIKSKDGKPFSIRSFKSTNNAITASFDPNKKATEFTLQPEINLEVLRRRTRGNISIALTHPDTKLVNISFEALPLFKVSRPSLVIKNAEPGVAITREISVLSNYGDPVEIESESLSSTKGYIKEIGREQNEKGVTLQLQITPPQMTNSKTRIFRDKLTITLQDGDKLTVNCTGIYKRKR
jgi:hypothetical protein